MRNRHFNGSLPDNQHPVESPPKKRDFLFSAVRKECVDLVQKTVFQRYAHILLKTVAVIEKRAMKFSGLPV